MINAEHANLATTIQRHLEEVATAPSLAASILARLIESRMSRLQRDHITTYNTDTLSWRGQEFFDTPEDLGVDMDGGCLYQHPVKDGCSVTKIGSQKESAYETTAVYLLTSAERHQFVQVTYSNSGKTEVTDIMKDEDCPAWAILQLKSKVVK